MNSLHNMFADSPTKDMNAMICLRGNFNSSVDRVYYSRRTLLAPLTEQDFMRSCSLLDHSNSPDLSSALWWGR